MKKIKKFILFSLLSLCLVSVGFVPTLNGANSSNIVNATSMTSTASSSIKAYKKFLKKNKYVYGPDKYYKMNYFATIDLDKNGVKELIMIDKSNREVTVYTYTNGKVKYCGNMYDRGIVYIDKNGRLARRFNNSGVKMNYYLTLNKKKQLSLVSYTYDKVEKKYYKETGVVESSEDYNRSKISKKTYNKAVKKSDFAKNVSKHLNNSSNRDKYLK
nr:hypothetical protein [uncultured Terrisporobacter sp.]